jgi:2-methylcitrate dehydratase
MPSRPFTWNDVVEKFDQLTADRIENDLAKDIKDAVGSLEHIQVRDLMALLVRVHVDSQEANK